jgi:hypothetical protein
VLESGTLGREVAERMAAERPHITKLALNPTLPSDLVARLAVDDDPRVRLAVSARPGPTEEERAAIGCTLDPDERLDTLRWVWDARDDPEVLRRCATSAHTWLRRSAAVCRGLPADMVELLARDEDFAVRLLLAEYHPAAPPELLLDLYLHGSHRAVAMLAAKPQFPGAGLAARLANADDPNARALVVRDPDATPAQIDRLSRDPVDRVRGGGGTGSAVAPGARARAAGRPGGGPADVGGRGCAPGAARTGDALPARRGRRVRVRCRTVRPANCRCLKES